MNILIDPLQYEFFFRALVVGTLFATSCALLGIFVVMRKEAVIGHAIANTAFLGVGLGLLLGIDLNISTFVLAIVGALTISLIQSKNWISQDSLLAFLAQLTFALAVFVLGLLTSYRIDVLQYLFGDILAISQEDLWISIPMFLLILIVFFVYRKVFLQVAFHPELRKSKGQSVSLPNTIFLVLVALTIAVGIKILGVVLISAFLVIPANAGRLLAKNFTQVQISTVVAGILASILGLYVSFYIDVPSGATIVVVMSLLLLFAFAWKSLRRSS